MFSFATPVVPFPRRRLDAGDLGLACGDVWYRECCPCSRSCKLIYYLSSTASPIAALSPTPSTLSSLSSQATKSLHLDPNLKNHRFVSSCWLYLLVPPVLNKFRSTIFGAIHAVSYASPNLSSLDITLSIKTQRRTSNAVVSNHTTDLRYTHAHTYVHAKRKK